MTVGDGERAPRRVGIRDVARSAGVSVASASVAINGRSGVSEQTRRRVLDAAAGLGYRADPRARDLRRGRTTTYGLVVRNFANPFFIDVIAGAEEVAAAAGATLLAVDARYSLQRERQHVLEMADRQCAGLAIAPVGLGDSIRLWQQLRPGLPTVALNAAVEGLAGVTRVSPDNARAVELALRRLAELGHVRIAFLCAPRRLMADPDRLRRFHELSGRLGIQPVIVSTALTLGGVQSAIRKVLNRPDPPTAVITNSDYTAHAVYKAARALPLQVGAELSVIGHDDLPTSELLDPPLTTLRLDRRAMGRALMRRLLDPGLTGDHIQGVTFVERASISTPSPDPVAGCPPAVQDGAIGRFPTPLQPRRQLDNGP